MSNLEASQKENVSQKTKLAWQCRRGMLELDVILKPFLDAHFDGLTTNQKDCFSRLLEETDPDLYSWLMGYAYTSDPEFAKMIALIQTQSGIAIKKS
jgi:antitoxin CptB